MLTWLLVFKSFSQILDNLPLKVISDLFSSVQSLSSVQIFATPWAAACQAFLSITNSQSLFRLMSIESVMPPISSSVIPFSSCLQSFPATGFFQMSQLFASSGQSIGVSASASVHSIEYPGLISIRIVWLDLLAVQGTLKSLLQHHSSKASIFWPSTFFIDQLLHQDMTTGKTIALTRWTFLSNVMSLLFNMLSRLFITFLSKTNM